MNWEIIEGNWKQFAGKVHERWGKLTNDDVRQIEGKKQQLVGLIEKHYGIAKDEANRQVDTWAKTLREEADAGKTGSAGSST